MELYTVSQVAEKLKINRNAVYELIKAGHIQALKLGSIKVTSQELNRFIGQAQGKDFTDLNNITEFKYVI